MKVLTASTAGEFETRISTIRRAEIRSKASAPPETARQDIFLSHSQRDGSLIPGVLAFFDSFAASVYVDVLDASFPATPSPFTAQKVKLHIKICRRLVVLVSEDNTPTSRWIPWEMGVGDGLRSYAHVALLPVGRSASLTGWLPNQEYFGIYPRIIQGPVGPTDFPQISGDPLPRREKQRDHSFWGSSSDWLVMDPASKGIWSMNDWLAEPLN